MTHKFQSVVLVTAIAAILLIADGCVANPDSSNEPSEPTTSQTNTAAKPTQPELTNDNVTTILASLVDVVEKCENGLCGLGVDPNNEYLVTTPGCRTVDDVKTYLSRFLSSDMIDKYVKADTFTERDGKLYLNPTDKYRDGLRLGYQFSSVKIASKQNNVYTIELNMLRNGEHFSTDNLQVQYINGSYQLTGVVYGSVAP